MIVSLIHTQKWDGSMGNGNQTRPPNLQLKASFGDELAGLSQTPRRCANSSKKFSRARRLRGPIG